MSIQNVIAHIAVSNLKGATAWYGRLLGHVAGSATLAKLERWRLSRGGWIQLRRSRSDAGSSSVSLLVNDLAAQRSAMEVAGYEFEDMGSESRSSATLLDPDGNSITLEQTLKPSPEPHARAANAGSAQAQVEAAVQASEAAQVLITSLHARMDLLEAEVVHQTNRADANDLARSTIEKASR